MKFRESIHTNVRVNYTIAVAQKNCVGRCTGCNKFFSFMKSVVKNQCPHCKKELFK